LSNRDGKVGRNGHPGREYWSRRHGGCLPWGRVGKQMTHEKERAAARRLERQALMEPIELRYLHHEEQMEG